jgi:hypothetical protein
MAVHFVDLDYDWLMLAIFVHDLGLGGIKVSWGNQTISIAVTAVCPVAWVWQPLSFG